MSTPSPLAPKDKVLPLLHGVRATADGWQARCPAHDDQHPSLSLRVKADGTLLLHCHAGCALAAVLGALGLQRRDLFPESPAARPRRSPVMTYDYLDEQRQLLYQVVRYEPKAFRQRRPDGAGGWLWTLQGVRRVLYRWPELLATPRDTRVFVVEGEKDADRLAALGLAATTSAGGAGQWPPAAQAAFAARSVVVLPDNDAAGRAHARQVAASVLPVAADLRVLELPGLPDKGDVSDWLNAGGTPAQLRALADAAPTGAAWLAEAPPEAEAAHPLLTWLRGVPEEAVAWLWPGRLPRGKLVLLDGDPGLGKSLLSLELAAIVSTGRPWPDGAAAAAAAPVVILNAEDGAADTLVPRLQAMGADLGRVAVLHGPAVAGVDEQLLLPRDLGRLRAAVTEAQAALLVIDPLMAFLDETINSASDQSVRRVLALLKQLAEDTRCAVLLIRHLNKTGGGKALYRGGGSIGIVGAGRLTYLVAPHPDEARLRVWAAVKNNLGPLPSSWAYAISADAAGRPRVEWHGAVALTADQLLAASARASPAAGGLPALERAKQFLAAVLAGGPQPAAEVKRLAAEAGIPLSTLARARQEMDGAVGHSATDQRQTVWDLPAVQAGLPLGWADDGPYQRGP